MPDFDKEGVVSLWVGLNNTSEGADILKSLCCVSSYDPDQQEIITDDEQRKLRDVGKMLQELSYSESFASKATTAAKGLGLTKALYIVAQFDYAYDPDQFKRRKVAKDPVFLGVFPYEDDDE